MKNDHGNIVPFPRVKERLIQKGMDALQEKDFKRALHHFQDAYKWDQNHAEIQMGMAICLMELGQLQEARDICKEMLHEDRGNYFTVLQIYLTILVQLGRYEEVQSTIEAVLEENKIPANQAEQFYKLLDFSRRMNKENPNNIELNSFHNEEHLLNNIDEQIKFVRTLKNSNSLKYIQTIQLLLKSQNVHPVIKTMILQELKDQEIVRKIFITKFGREMFIKPIELKDIADFDFTKQVLNILEDYLAIENPTLFEVVKDLWIRHLYVLYPFHPEPLHASLWSAALHQFGYELHGIDIESNEMEELYGVKEHELRVIRGQIQYIEQISNLEI